MHDGRDDRDSESRGSPEYWRATAYPSTEGIPERNDYLVAVVGRAAGVQAGQKALGLLLDTGGRWQGQQQSGQLLCSVLVSLLRQKTAGSSLTPPSPCRMNRLHSALLFLPTRPSGLG